ncbi:MAG: hypothetical protein KGI52_03500 [Burkholderiales bacterium]|nr:hypothetical protein [Burkholderiales bacterium]
MFELVKKIQAATLAARERTGDKTIGTHAKDGKTQIIRVSYDDSGKSSVTPVGDWMAPDLIPAALEKIEK